MRAEREEALPPRASQPGRTIMPCPFLSSDYLLTCRALWKVYIPSMLEIDELCRHEKHTLCPFYCRSKTDGTFILDDAALERSDSSSSRGSGK